MYIITLQYHPHLCLFLEEPVKNKSLFIRRWSVGNTCESIDTFYILLLVLGIFGRYFNTDIFIRVLLLEVETLDQLSYLNCFIFQYKPPGCISLQTVQSLMLYFCFMSFLHQEKFKFQEPFQGHSIICVTNFVL